MVGAKWNFPKTISWSEINFNAGRWPWCYESDFWKKPKNASKSWKTQNQFWVVPKSLSKGTQIIFCGHWKWFSGTKNHFWWPKNVFRPQKRFPFFVSERGVLSWCIPCQHPLHPTWGGFIPLTLEDYRCGCIWFSRLHTPLHCGCLSFLPRCSRFVSWLGFINVI